MTKEILPNKDPNYLEFTEKCPRCYGRGRVPKGNAEFEKGTDTYKQVYEEEKAIEEVEGILKIARGNDGYNPSETGPGYHPPPSR